MANTFIVCCKENRYRRYIGRTHDFTVISDEPLSRELVEILRVNPSELKIDVGEDGIFK